MSTQADPWPLRHLVLRTPRLELRPDDDAGLLELVDVAHRGVHPPERTPFISEWTDAPPDELGRNTLQFMWAQRAASKPDSWTLNFLVRADGVVVGVQGLEAANFAATREVSTGSWLGREHQGAGIGTEMRAAVLAFAFDHLGAGTARSGAFVDNPASLRVSEKLGYVRDGTACQRRRDERVLEHRLLLAREAFVRPGWSLDVVGLPSCRVMLGAGSEQR